MFQHVRGLAPTEKLSVAQFAEKHLVNPEGRLRGRPLLLNAQQRGVVEAFNEPGVEFVVLRSSAQAGKTVILISLIAYHIAQDPATVLMVLPAAVPMARDFSRERLDPLIQSSTKLSRIVYHRRSKAGSNSVTAKQFPGGSLALAGATSAAQLASRPVRVLLMDEVSKYESDIRGEGDPVSLGIRRMQTFVGRRRAMLTSTPASPEMGDVRADRITEWFDNGDRRYWIVTCPHCPKQSRITWDDQDSFHITYEPGKPATAAVVCPDCRKAWTEPERKRAIDSGAWSPSARAIDASIASFQLWSGETAWGNLPDIVRQREKAEAKSRDGDVSPLREWVQGTLGIPFDSSAVADLIPEISALRRGLLERVGQGGAVPSDALLVGAVDVQHDRLIGMAVAADSTGKLWLLDWHESDGETGDPDDPAWADMRKWFTARGVVRIACDSGDQTDTVYEVCQRPAWARAGWYLIKGSGTQTAAIVRPPKIPDPAVQGGMLTGGKRIVSSRVRLKRELWTVGTYQAKAALYRQLALPADSPRAICPAGAGDWKHGRDWFARRHADSIVSERLDERVVKTTGQIRLWWRPLSKDNHGLDLLVYSLHAYRTARQRSRPRTRSRGNLRAVK